MYRNVLRRVVKAGCAVLLFGLVWHLLSHPNLGVPLRLSIAGMLSLTVFYLLSHGRQVGLARLPLLDKGTQTPSHAGSSADAGNTEPTVSSPLIDKSVDTALALVRRGGPWWRLGRHSAYRLPWYLVLGSSTDEPEDWLDATSLRFSHNSFIAGMQAGRSPYTWRFADEAVFVDARNDHGNDSALWHGLLKRLRRVRKRCPINGVIAAVHVRDLMHDDAHLLRAQAQALRERLDAMQLRFGRRFPVYVMVVYMQTLPGFSALFGDLDATQRQQFWGLTFPLPHRQTSDPASQWSSLFRERFQSLCLRLDALLIDRIVGIRDVSRNAEAYAFAHNMTRLEPALAQYLDEAFGYSPYAPQAMLRAVGFTAIHARPAKDKEKPNLDGYFMAHFLRRGIFPERWLAGQSANSARHQRVRQGLILSALSLLALGIALALWGSYQRNQNLLAQANAVNALIAKEAPQGILKDDPWSALPLLDIMRDRLPLKDVTVPLSYRLGLYQGHRVETAIGGSYRALLHQALLPVIATRLSAYLRADDTDPATRYSCLRIYLMLGTPTHYDAGAVMAWLQEDVKRWPGQSNQRSDFIAHALALVSDPTFRADLALDQTLIARTRTTLSSYPLASHLFHIISANLAASNLQPLSVAEMGGINTPLVLYRRSASPLSEGISGAYTLAGYLRYLTLRHGLLEKAQDDSWILDQTLALGDEAERVAILRQVDRTYLDSYIKAWDVLLGDVAVKPIPLTGDDASARFHLLADTDSPLRALLHAASTQTSLDDISNIKAASTPAKQGTMERLRHLLDAPLTSGSSKGDLDPMVDAHPVTGHFDDLHRLMAAGTKDSPSPFTQVQDALEDVAVFLDATHTAQEHGMAPPANDALLKLEEMAPGLPAPLPGMLATLSGGANAVAFKNKYTQWNALWQAQVMPFCKAAIQGRYPFERHSATDVTLQDFTRLFASGTILDTFFHDYIAPDVDMTHTPWRWKKDIAPPGMSAQTLAMFEQAAAIRSAFFTQDSKTINVSFTLIPQTMDAELTRLVFTLDDQTLDYAHGPRQAFAFVWPKTKDPQTARIAFEPADEQGHSMLNAQGPWALFRLLDKATVLKQGSDRYSVTFQSGKRNATFELQAGSVINPFGLTVLDGFQCHDNL